MPGNLHFFDTTLPREADANGKSAEEQLSGIYNYLYMLLEQLRYTLANLDSSNFNTAAYAPIADTIRKMNGLRLVVGSEGNETTFSLTSNGLVISSARQLELYSITGELPPVGVVGGVYVNSLGQNVLEHGWYDEYDDDWTGSETVYCCATYNGGETWGAVYIKSGKTGSQGEDGFTVLLNNNPHVFPGSESAALASSTNVGVIAMLGTVRQSVTINGAAGAPSGMTYTVHSNGTPNAYLTVRVTETMTTQSGELSVSVTVNGETYVVPWSWSVAYKGSSASVDFDNVNNALANLFVKISQGTPTTVTDYKIYSPIIEAAIMYASKIYAGEGSGYTQMSAGGLDVYNAAGLLKARLGYTSGATDYPFLQLGAGSDRPGTKGLIKKFSNGLWLGNDVNENDDGTFSPKDGCHGIFCDFEAGEVYVVNDTDAVGIFIGQTVARFG